ncbi:MAG: hypothetical protein IPH34_06355 [Chitinophagaceae bacterium]|nr:hypothetical protein [Chitinophagaceae bacterium]MBK8607732.1 hypothetical protein [Chitinophagaceae bacterium]MBP7107116.1 hypothetical protein [Chitinophagaceae bacterium]MBP7314885.1 hypothetical protein [Chitinophagaceae bacterium]
MTFIFRFINCYCFLIAGLLISCSGNLKNGKHTITDKWQLMEIKSSNGNTEKAPSPTFFTFNEDASYKFELYKADSLLINYRGAYRFIGKDELLETVYEYGGEKNIDTAAILGITEDDMKLLDKKNGDTLFFKRK